jgi:hypothetical protein
MACRLPLQGLQKTCNFEEHIMKKSSIVVAGLTLVCSSAVFAQIQPIATDHSDGLSTAYGSVGQPETAGNSQATTVGDVTYNPANPTPSSTSRRQRTSGTHATEDTVTTGTSGQPAGDNTGMSGSGPGVPANANGMGTTPR